MEDEKKFVVVNGKEGKAYDGIWDTFLTPDSQYICYGAQINNEFWWIVDKVEDYIK